jgi:hypothetical protein
LNPSNEPIDIIPSIKFGPYTQNITEDSITIIWETNFPSTNNILQFGETKDYEFIIYDNNDSYHHEITIKPCFSSGFYKIVSDSLESEDLSFHLSSHYNSTKKMKCILIGDSRGTWDKWKNATIVSNAVNNESADFVIHGGDMVDDGTSLIQWDNWLELMNPLMKNSTVFGVIGNHERNASRYYEIFALPNNEMWYSFDYGPCHFIILDNYVKWDENSAQYSWLEEDLSSTIQPFIIVCFHEPIYCSGGHSPRIDVRETWEPLFNHYNVDLVIQSHCHFYQRTNPINGTIYVVTGGAGAPLYSPRDSWLINKSEKIYHYCMIEVFSDETELIFTVKDVDGNIIDIFNIKSFDE